jgi:hypothetical protein
MISKLLEYNYRDIDLFCSKDMKEERGLIGVLDVETVTFSIIRNFLELNREYKELTEAYAKKNNLENIAILMAHGDEIKNKWYYYNKDKFFSVQSWINKMDGKYKLLIIDSCNPGRNEVKSKKSPILMPNETYSGLLLDEGKVQIEFFLPEIGYVDSYMVEEELKKLKD